MFTTPESTALPMVSVVMTVYRDLRFLDAAVNSVLAQDFPSFELIIVDDGNRLDAIFAGLARRDPRIRVVNCPENVGSAAATNSGIAVARSDIILRLDADDICEPERIGQVVAAFAQDPALGLLGSDVLLIAETGEPLREVRMPRSDLEIRWTILFHNPFYHSSVAFRKQPFVQAGGYRADKRVSEDHFMWFDLLDHTRACNLPQTLVRYRLNPQGLTMRNTQNPRNRTHAIRQKLWSRLGLEYDLFDDIPALDITGFLRGGTLPPDRRAAAYAMLRKVLAAFLAGPDVMPDAALRDQGETLRAALEARFAAEPVPA